jgi:pimeloyl-ACP methyl ester carboxylesterase
VSLRAVPAVAWHTTTVGGTPLRWLDAGEGDPLLFLHGWGLSPRAYVRPVTPLTRAGIRVLAPELRCATLDDAADRAAAFLDGLRLDRPAFVMGHSLGGGVAIRLATRRPDLVRSLTLLNSVGGAPGKRSGMTPRPWWQWAVGAVAEAHPRTMFESGARATAEVVTGVVRDLVPALAKHPLASALSAYAALSADLSDEVRRLVDDGLPVLFVWGDRDRLITPGAFAEIETAMSPEVVQGRHGWLLTAPHEFAQLLHNALVVHAMLERSRRGQRVTGPFRDADLFPAERRHRARRGDTGTRAQS